MVGISEELAKVAEGLHLSTVRVRSGEGGGTGVIWGSAGAVVTNAHVVRGGDAVVELWDGRRVQGRLARSDPYRDLAVLRVDAPNLPSAVLRDSHDVRPGELVVAVGNPLGSRQAVSVGVVHTVGPLAGAGSNRWVQSDVHLQPGNSGGPLADTRGRVVGINSMIAHGLALSAPADEVGEFLARRHAGAWLGITTRPVYLRLGRQILPALTILEVEARSAAARAGLDVGDILLSADGLTFTAPDDLPRRLSGMTPGSTLLIDLLRSRRRLTVVATVGRAALRPEAA
jgi:serine protease Do